MPDIPPEAVQAATKAVRMHEWAEGSPWSVHAIHTFSGECAVCTGDLKAITTVTLEALAEAGLVTVSADMLRDAEKALADLGACDNPGCETTPCTRVLPRLRAALHERTEIQ